MAGPASSTDTDILVSGAGIAGMVTAALLARQGWRVTICDPAPPIASASDAGSDLRSTAYLAPSVDVMERAGLWSHLAPHSTALRALQVVDSVGWPPRLTGRRTFMPHDIGLDAFGWNVPNWRARKVLAEILSATDGVDLRLGTGFRDMLARDDGIRVRLSDGSSLKARLVVGADGRASPVREAAGIGTRLHRYAQKALAFAVTHERPHDGVSTEIYNSGGAFTTVPLPDHQGRPASAIVWMNDGRRAVDLAGLPREAFIRELDLRGLRLLGRMAPITPLRMWPIITQEARRLTARRVALVAEAAHVLPPIGAQGLNTSLADIAALSVAVQGPDPGATAALDRYAAARRRDIAVRVRAIDLFNRICQSDGRTVQALRLKSLETLHDFAPLRRGAMRAGMGR